MRPWEELVQEKEAVSDVESRCEEWNMWRRRFHCQACVCLGFMISRNPTIIYTLCESLQMDGSCDASILSSHVASGVATHMVSGASSQPFNIQKMPLSNITLQPLLCGVESFLAAQAIALSTNSGKYGSCDTSGHGNPGITSTTDVISGVYMILDRFEKIRLRLLGMWAEGGTGSDSADAVSTTSIKTDDLDDILVGRDGITREKQIEMWVRTCVEEIQRIARHEREKRA